MVRTALWEEVRLTFDVVLARTDIPSRTHCLSESGTALRAMPMFSRSVERCSRYCHMLLMDRTTSDNGQQEKEKPHLLLLRLEAPL